MSRGTLNHVMKTLLLILSALLLAPLSAIQAAIIPKRPVFGICE